VRGKDSKSKTEKRKRVRKREDKIQFVTVTWHCDEFRIHSTNGHSCNASDTLAGDTRFESLLRDQFS
jgi:hypothetical protein